VLVLILVKVCACVRLAAVKNHCMCVSRNVEMVFFMYQTQGTNLS